MAFPSGWHVREPAPTELIGDIAEEGQRASRCNAGAAARTPPREFLSRMLAQYSAGQAEPLEVNGLQGYTAIVRSALPGFRGPARYAVIYYNKPSSSPPRARARPRTPSADPLFMSTIKTFRRLNQNEFALAEPYRIKAIRADDKTRIGGPGEAPRRSRSTLNSSCGC